MPNQGDHWPICHTGTDTDGRYCLVSVSRSGPGPLHPAYDTPGTYANPFVALVGPGDLHIGLDTVVVHGDLSVDESPGVPSGDSWTYTVNTGSIRPAELSATAQDVSLTLGGNATSGYTATVTFSPTPVAWLTSATPCSYDGGCGDDTTVANFTFAHYADGVVTDDSTSGLTSSQISARRGFVRATNAENTYALYVGSTNTLEIRMANPHLAAPGVPAKGSYETFLSNTYLSQVLEVPDPSALTTTGVTVVRAGSSTPVTFTLSHTSRGVRLSISDITFAPLARYLIHPRPSAPGAPRWGSVQRTSKHSVRVRFRAPLANGGKPVTAYRARCHAGTGAWHTVKRGSSPITVSSLPRRGVSCEVAAHNTLGWGVWSRARKEG